MSTSQVFEFAPDAASMRDTLSKDDPLHGELMNLNMGPQHPATHGVLRIKVVLDGETMKYVEPVVGYLHRGKEKTCETLGWRKFVVHTDRLDYVQPLMNNCGYFLALEKLADLEVPERGNQIRVLLMELSRIMAHLIYLGTTGIDLGAVTMFFFTFAERERIYTLLDAYTGHRMNNTYVRLGGVYADVDESVESAVREWVEQFPKKIDEFEQMLTGNRIWYDRNRDIGVLTPAMCAAWSLTGPNLRASGIEWDLRKKQPYSGYENYQFDVPIGQTGDCYDRYAVRIEEMRQSTRICAQVLDALQKTRGGEFLAEDRRYVLPPKERVRTSMEELIYQFKIVTDMSLPKGEAYHAVESSKGELGFYVVSDGGDRPYRVRCRPPCLMPMAALPRMIEGGMVADMVPTFGSVNMIGGELDR